MRHAYLVLAHHDGPGLLRLLRALRHAGVSFYVHIDANADDALVETVRGCPDVTVVARTKVRYKAFSMVEATLTLLRRAVADGHDRYSLVSGADYPVVANEQIVQRLSAGEQQFLTFWRLEDRPSWQHKVQYHYPTEHISIRDPQKTVFRRLFWAAFRRGRRFAKKRVHPSDLVPYGGSQWWTFTHECAADVLDFVDRRPDVVRFYRTTESPDELFFQTVVLNGPHARSVLGFDDYEDWRREVLPWQPVSVTDEKLRMLPDHVFNLRYIDWDGEVTGEREAPAVLDERDLTAVLGSGCLWARKFDAERSHRLLDELDRRR